MAILDLASFILRILNTVVVPLIFALAFVMFIWGCYVYFFSPENSGKREEGRKFIVSSVIGFAVMISIWGLVNVVVNTFGFNQVNRPALPYFGGSTFGSWGPGGNVNGGNQFPSGDCRALKNGCPGNEVCLMVRSNYYQCQPPPEAWGN